MAIDDSAKLSSFRVAPWIGQSAFVVFLLLIFVSLTPFQVRDPSQLALGESGFSGAGDLWRQVFYLGVFAVIFIAALDKRGFGFVRAMPITLAILLVWCVASAGWAASPDITVRRAGLEVIIVLSAMLSVDTLGPKRSLELLRWVLAGVLIVNWISIPLVPQAVHLPGEIDPALIGDWRGLYYHKNIAGAVCAVSALVFLFFAVEKKSRLDWLLFIGAVGFTVMTKSKSSMGFLPIAIFAAVVFRAVSGRGLDRTVVIVVALLAVFAVIAISTIDATALAKLLEDPDELTGRTAIWQAEIAFIHDHLFLGSGFGTFADTGNASPLHSYVGGGWVETVAHGHNAYLQMFVTIGGVGFVLAMIAFVIQPALAFARGAPAQSWFKPLLFAIFVFTLLHNILESDFLEGDGPAWVAFLIMIAMLRRLSRDEAEISKSPVETWLAQ
ncbi:MAG TPA: O-antigen ligase family protein [Rhizomicrobium sp.]|jgi:O-antigen ligase|nr:O-antigen ligase family protein [Rhizomicrobium sp.]